MTKDELRSELERRNDVRHHIMPMVILAQLHVGSIDADKIVDHIMGFDECAINKAIHELEQRGLAWQW